MLKIMADHHCAGHLQVLLRCLTSAAWDSLWTPLDVQVETFARLGLPTNTTDTVLWRRCQEQGILLLTSNRNAEGPESLEAVIARDNTPMSLPVLTLGTPVQVLQSRAYADRVVTRLLEILLDLEQYRGTGRLSLP